MKFSIEILGPIKKADIELGDLTIICGKNSTGKTYITYSLIAFFSYIRHCQFMFIIDDNDTKEIKAKGEVSLDVKEYKERFREIIEEKDNYFNDTYLSSLLAIKHKQEQLTWKLPEDFINNDPYIITRNITATCDLKATWNKNQKKIKFQLTNRGEGYPTDETIEMGISTILNNFFKEKFISETEFTSFTCERTGVALFGNDLIAADFIKKTDKDSYKKVVPNEPSFYQMPIRKEIMNNIDFSYLYTDSFITQKHPQILECFEDIVKGKYVYDDTIKQMMFIPEGTTDIKLTMHQSSSTVRSLKSFDFFLRHQIQPHQTIVMDEPELNLHPENQRKLARLFAMLVNIGIKVIITTHSDYIIREFNALIMLKNDRPILKKIQESEGYTDSELLNSSSVKVYSTVQQNDGVVLEVAPVSQKDGITINTLDDVINKMNQIHEAIYWGE